MEAAQTEEAKTEPTPPQDSTPQHAIPPTAEATPALQIIEQKQKRHLNGAQWFYWIAAMSLITSFINLSGGEFGFAISLGITQFFDGMALAFSKYGTGNWIKYLSFCLDIAVAVILFLIGRFAQKGYKSAYLVGIIGYALDSLLLLLVQDWISIAFHVLALIYIGAGFSALRYLERNPGPALSGAA